MTIRRPARRWLPLGYLLLAWTLRAETGYEAWLRYAPLQGASLQQSNAAVPAIVVMAGDSKVLASARDELVRGMRGMLGRTLQTRSSLPAESAILLGTWDELHRLSPQLTETRKLEPESFCLRKVNIGGISHLVVAGADDRGVLYGVFALLRKVSLGESLTTLNETQSPYVQVRWINQWDNLDGTIERGYGGHSIFWDGGHVRDDLSRVADYGRLLASIGINGCTINNVNADKRVLTPSFIPQAARIADALRPWGIRVSLAVDFGSPQTIGGLDTFDPLDPRVIEWWRAKAAEVYQAIPDLAGFVLKADSEGRVGPAAYHRTHADAANMLARALKPHGGLLLYRGFVYDHHMDWRNLRNDRARAAYDNFKPLDGQFDDNVLVQIKNGPIDFQVREPVSPLFGALEKTNEALELQITQEYVGQARHLVFLVPQWKEVLDFDLSAMGAGTPVKALASGRTFGRPLGGFVGVANAGLDINWYSNQMSPANLYGFGRLAWNPDLTSQSIAQEWTQQTFGNDPKVIATIRDMLLKSWPAYENYTGPLGLQTLTDIVGNHYGVAVEASEQNGWGQWHRADKQGVGMDRTVATGTGFIGQYRPPVAKKFESLQECPDDLLLFMHHVPYTHVLHSGKTVIQSIYDSHYAGAQAAAAFVTSWESLRGRVDEQRFEEVLKQLNYQAGQADVWRDGVSNWFRQESGIDDADGRVGQHAGRFEAESMQLQGYSVVGVTPWEAASGGKAVMCSTGKCSARVRFDGEAGQYTLQVQYFDQNGGAAHFRLVVAGKVVDEWAAGEHLPTTKLDGTSSMRRSVTRVALQPGNEILIEGSPDGSDMAGVDYLDILPSPLQGVSHP
jgi:alpha-glucuronidase